MGQTSYLEFENEMRGSREVVSERQKVYLPLLGAIKDDLEGVPAALDIGSGRGEWLQLLDSLGWDALGVDSNSGMISFCESLGLNVCEADAATYLATLPAHRFDLISAFHVVEHIPVAELGLFAQRCLHALKPGGILLLETPNPQNLLVGSSEFYVDPTHTRAVPPKLLDFILRDAGFQSNQLLFLNGRCDVDQTLPQLADVILGVGYDYAIIGRKPGATLSRTDLAIQSTVESTTRAELSSRLLHFDDKMREMQQHVRNNEARIGQLEAELRRLKESAPLRYARALANLFRRFAK